MVRAGKAIMLVVIVLNLLSSWGTDGSFGNEDSENSVLSAIGKEITPILRPMGVKERKLAGRGWSVYGNVRQGSGGWDVRCALFGTGSG